MRSPPSSPTGGPPGTPEPVPFLPRLAASWFTRLTQVGASPVSPPRHRDCVAPARGALPTCGATGQHGPNPANKGRYEAAAARQSRIDRARRELARPGGKLQVVGLRERHRGPHGDLAESHDAAG